MKKSTLYKNSFLFIGAFLILLLNACTESKENRVSPPATASTQVGDVTLTIDYSQPSVKGRKIWGELVPYNQIWRTGANEATVFDISGDITVGDQTLTKGKYALFTIPKQGDTWEVILNTEHDQWGAYNYDESKDAIKRFDAQVQKTDKFTEIMTFEVNTDGTVKLLWENLEVSFQISA